MINKIFVAESKSNDISFLFPSLEEAVEFVIGNLENNKEVFEVFAALQFGEEIFSKRRIIYESPSTQVL